MPKFQTPKRKRASAMISELSNARKATKVTPVVEGVTDWQIINLSNNKLQVIESAHVQVHATVDFHPDVDLDDIFLRWVSKDLCAKIWNQNLKTAFSYRSKGCIKFFDKGIMNYAKVLRFLAVVCRIHGAQNFKKEGGQSVDLAKDIQIQSEFLAQAHADPTPVGQNYYRRLVGNFYFVDEFAEALFRNIQDTFTDLGQLVAGDEKLFDYTGASNDVRSIPSKPGNGVGIWYYELVVELENERPVLIWTAPSQAERNLEVAIPVATIVKKWCEIMNRHGEKTPNPDSILCFDSYYTTKASVDECMKSNIKFVASAKKNNFQDYVALIEGKVTQKGDWATIFSPTRELLFTFRWSNDDNVGKKYCISNAFRMSPNTRSGRNTVPGYDLYKMAFNSCDIFNRNLHHRVWPHRTGGRNRTGDTGNYNKFVWAALLQNIFSVHESVSRIDYSSLNWSQKCLRLADLLYMKALTLPSDE